MDLSTGYNDIILKSEAFLTDTSNTEVLVKETDKQYRLNDLRDRTINKDNPIWDSSWASVQSSYYIDKVPFNSNIDYNQSPFDAKRFRDYYTGLRLFFNPSIDAKISTDIISTFYANRNR